MFIQGKPEYQLKYTLQDRYSIKQAEQLAIVRALEIIEKLRINENTPRTVTVHTDSRITLQSLQNTKITVTL